MTTILDRSVEAFQEVFSEALHANPDNALRMAVAGLLIHVGGELLALDANQPDIKAHQVADRLLRSAQEVEP